MSTDWIGELGPHASPERIQRVKLCERELGALPPWAHVREVVALCSACGQSLADTWRAVLDWDYPAKRGSAAEWLRYYGIEHVADPAEESGGLSYANSGDTYKLTLCATDEGELFIGSWGGWIEEREAKRQSENKELRCGYCGEWTEHTEGLDWSDVTCEHCNHNVAGG